MRDKSISTLQMASALAALAIVWVVGFFVFARTPTAPPLAEMEVITRSADFRAGSRDIGIDPCLALPYQDPELIILGTSHVYAGVSAQTLEESTELRTAYCGIPAFKTDTLLPFIDYLDRHELRPNRLVLMVDPSVLRINDNSDQNRLEDTKRLLSDRKLAVDRAARWQSRVENGLPPLALDYQTLQTSLRHQRDAIDKVDPGRIDALVRDNDRRLFFIPYGSRDRLKPNPRNKKNLAEFCRFIEKTGIRLDIVNAPLPDLTAEISNIDWAKFRETLRSAVSCADSIIVRDFSGWGLDMRHLVNRKMVDDYDYTVWERTDEEFAAYVDTLDRPAIQRLVDSSHLNGVGAEIFTRELVNALELD